MSLNCLFYNGEGGVCWRLSRDPAGFSGQARFIGTCARRDGVSRRITGVRRSNANQAAGGVANGTGDPIADGLADEAKIIVDPRFVCVPKGQIASGGRTTSE